MAMVHITVGWAVAGLAGVLAVGAVQEWMAVWRRQSQKAGEREEQWRREWEGQEAKAPERRVGKSLLRLRGGGGGKRSRREDVPHDG